jgi:PAS domain S-box-containing protein
MATMDRDHLGRALMVEQNIITDLRAKLREAEQTLDAIRYGEVDAVLVKEAGSSKIFTLVNADRPYRFLIEQMKEGAVTLSEEGVILYANRRLGEILGTAFEKVVGSNIKRYFSAEDIKKFENLLLAKGTDSSRAEFTVQQSQGMSIPVFISIVDIVSGDSSARLIGGVITDLSDQREMEARFSQAQKMEAVGQLTGGLAHDFNNLLQIVCANLDLIKMCPANLAGVQKWADNGLKAAARGTKLTAQLLAFSRLQAIELQPVDVTALITGMADLLLRALGIEIDIEYALEKTSISVLADKTQLELALLNLAINARDAMPQGGCLRISTQVVSVGSDPELTPGQYLELSVTDTGSGMSDKVRSRAFDPFFTTKKIGEGTGLGLAQVYGITRQAGGTARIISSAETGTMVTLYLRQTATPAVLNKADEEDRIIDVVKAATKILIIDDDDDIRNILAECLTVLGYDVSETSNGFSALDMMAVSLPDILLTDYFMPIINGSEVVKRARANGFNMPVIFASGYSNTEALDEAIGFKANVLVKPFSIQVLVQAIETALSNQ